MLKVALKYLNFGWSIIPVRQDKKPLIKWTEYQNRKPEEAEVKDWWTKWPQANIGVVTGKVSGIIVVDIENEKGKNFLQRKMPNIFNTLVNQTGGGGYHLYFKCPQEKIPNSVKIFDDVDIRGESGYAVVPPSKHQSGKSYKWLFQKPPAELPDFIKNHIQQQGNQKLQKEDWETTIVEGNRDEELTRRVGKLLRIDIPPNEILTLASSWNEKHCNPPLPKEQVEKIVNSITKREYNKQKIKKEEKFDFKVIDFGSALDNYGLQDVEWTIDNWMPKHTIGMLVSPPGHYKTWLLLDLAVSIATGKNFLNHFYVKETGPVLMIQQEDPFPLLFSRLCTIMNMGAPKFENGMFELPTPPDKPPIFWHPDRKLNFMDTNSIAGLEEAIKRVKPKLVILDPLYSAGDTSDYMAEAATKMLALKTIRDNYECAFMIAHHTKKSRTGSGREDLWGSQFLNAWLETGWQIRPGGTNAIKLQRHFKHSKEPDVLKLSFEISKFDFRVDIEGVQGLEETKKDIIELLKTTKIRSQREIAEKLEMEGLGTINKILKEINVQKQNGIYKLGGKQK